MENTNTMYEKMNIAGVGKRIFIGSSSQALEKALYVQAILRELHARADVWDEIFTPGQITIHELVEKTRKYDGAVLILADDDQIIREHIKYSEDDGNSSKEVRTIPRDNVLVEAGMFMGVLGTEAVTLCEVPGV